MKLSNEINQLSRKEQQEQERTDMYAILHDNEESSDSE